MKSIHKIQIIVLIALTLIMTGIWGFADSIRAAAYASAGASQWVAGIPGRTAVLCVANLEGAAVGRDVLQKVNTAFMKKVKTHRDFHLAGLDAVVSLAPSEAAARVAGIDPLIRAGCPSSATLHTNRWGNNRVSSPGSVQTYVFVASAEQLSSVAFKHYPRVAGHEYICEDGQCNSVANALYITPEEIDNPGILAQALTSGVGLSNDNENVPVYINGVTPDNKLK